MSCAARAASFAVVAERAVSGLYSAAAAAAAAAAAVAVAVAAAAAVAAAVAVAVAVAVAATASRGWWWTLRWWPRLVCWSCRPDSVAGPA
ncbi:unnamed protein product [Rotaria sp. Silwood1]|nr:unnamed protein product [Rotaria sp. Silwood1]